VRARAGGLCEYCHLADEHSEAPFEVDHIIARQHHGKTVLSNLAWSCLRCNLYKGPNISGIDRLGSPVMPRAPFPSP
jgi:5-methylcytosine-specific restriction endonuclease McrA